MRLEFQTTVIAPPLVAQETSENSATSHDRDFAALLKGGIAAAQSGQRESARDLLARATDSNPVCEDAWMWRASVSDYPEELLGLLDRVLEINPQNGRALEWHAATRSLLAKTFVQRAVAAHREHSMGLVRQCLEQALGYDPNCEMAWFWKASVAESAEDKIDCLGRVLKINPANLDALEALDSVRQANAQTILDESKAAAVAGKRKKALELVDEFLRSVPANAEAWILRSHLSTSIEDKVVSLEQALAIDPANAVASTANYEFLTSTLQSVGEQAQSVESGPEPEVPHELADNLGVECGEPAPDLPEPSVLDRLCNDVVELVDADSVTVESLSPFAEKAEVDAVVHMDFADNEDDVGSDRLRRIALGNPAAGTVCPFCNSVNETQAFECTSCRALLSLADLEALLANRDANRDTIQHAVTQMEAEWNLREFSEEELTALGIGHFNLRNFGPGFSYLQEALRLNPNNVILAGQVNTLAIRLDELRRQNEVPDTQPRGKTILVVDDSATVRKLIAGKLEKSGHRVLLASDGVEAIECIETEIPDLVLLDIAMPRMDGYEVCKQIRANPEAADLPVVMISGKDGFFDKVRGRMAGTSGYVTKPFGPETLMKALETYLLPEEDEE